MNGEQVFGEMSKRKHFKRPSTQGIVVLHFRLRSEVTRHIEAEDKLQQQYIAW